MSPQANCEATPPGATKSTRKVSFGDVLLGRWGGMSFGNPTLDVAKDSLLCGRQSSSKKWSGKFHAKDKPPILVFRPYLLSPRPNSNSVAMLGGFFLGKTP